MQDPPRQRSKAAILLWTLHRDLMEIYGLPAPIRTELFAKLVYLITPLLSTPSQVTMTRPQLPGDLTGICGLRKPLQITLPESRPQAILPSFLCLHRVHIPLALQLGQ